MSADTAFLRAASLSRTGEREAAQRIAEDGVLRYPEHAGFRALLGSIEFDKLNYQRAAELLRQSLDLNPDAAGVWQGFAVALFMIGDFEGSRQASERALQDSAQDPSVLGNYAGALRNSGNSQQAIAYYRKACLIEPGNWVNRTGLLFTMLFDGSIGAANLLEEAQDWANTLRSAITAPAPAWQPGSGRIRLGVMSDDLRQHACACFLIPFIANLDRTRFEVFLFSLNPVEDRITEKMKQYADGLVKLSSLPELDVVRTVRQIGLDALIDLGGYTGRSPLQYMVHQLAPVQLTWLGYPGTTGMKEIQYRISDWVADPAGNDANYTEALLRAPIFCAYHPLITNPLAIYSPRYRVKDTPARENGFITFGSCNSIAKLTPETFRLWAAVLARCPDSRLLVEAAGVQNEQLRQRLETQMAMAGLDIGRVDLIARDTRNQYLTYHRIDIVLDTTPVTGGTTTCDALWMGVPVVTLSGNAFHQRISTPFLHAVGLGQLACDNEEQFVEAAMRLAADVHSLDGLRKSLRQRVEQSTMCDAAGFATWFGDQVVTLLDAADRIPQAPTPPGSGIYFAGVWHSAETLAMAIAEQLQSGERAQLRNLLENITSTWHRHWMVAYALAELAHAEGDIEEALNLLLEAIAARPYSLQLYRLLADWLTRHGLDKSALGGLLREQFGLALDALEEMPIPTQFAVLGINPATSDATAGAVL